MTASALSFETASFSVAAAFTVAAAFEVSSRAVSAFETTVSAAASSSEVRSFFRDLDRSNVRLFGQQFDSCCNEGYGVLVIQEFFRGTVRVRQPELLRKGLQWQPSGFLP